MASDLEVVWRIRPGEAAEEFADAVPQAVAGAFRSGAWRNGGIHRASGGAVGKWVPAYAGTTMNLCRCALAYSGVASRLGTANVSSRTNFSQNLSSPEMFATRSR